MRSILPISVLVTTALSASMSTIRSTTISSLSSCSSSSSTEPSSSALPVAPNLSSARYQNTTIQTIQPNSASSDIRSIISSDSEAPETRYEYETDTDYTHVTKTVCDANNNCYVTVESESLTTYTTTIDGVLTVITTAVSASAAATATAATNWKPKNPASNPLETKKKFVTIKRPDQDKIESMKKITSPKLVPTQVGTIYSTEKGALEEAHRRSLDEREHGPKFLLPMEREGDVSEINQQNYHGENGSHHHIDIPMNGNGNGNDNHNHNQANHSNGSHTGNIDIPIPEYQESRSYKTGGIVESVVNVQGVLKVIIENVTDADDDEDEIALAIENLSSNDNNNKKHKLKKSKKSKKKLKKSPSSTLKSVTTSLNDDDVNDDQTVEQTQSLLHSGNGSRNSSIGSNTSNNK